MATPVRIERLQARIKERASVVISQEMADPRLGFITLTKVKLARDLTVATIFYSVLGNDRDKNLCRAALEHARGFIQREVARSLHTRITPMIHFEYDVSVEGALRVSSILEDLRKERIARGTEEMPDDGENGEEE